MRSSGVSAGGAGFLDEFVRLEVGEVRHGAHQVIKKRHLKVERPNSVG